MVAFLFGRLDKIHFDILIASVKTVKELNVLLQVSKNQGSKQFF